MNEGSLGEAAVWDVHLCDFPGSILASSQPRISFDAHHSLSTIFSHSSTELPKMESKDLQQLFKDVLGSEREQHLGCGTPGLDGNRTPLQRPFLQGDPGGSGLMSEWEGMTRLAFCMHWFIRKCSLILDLL